MYFFHSKALYPLNDVVTNYDENFFRIGENMKNDFSNTHRFVLGVYGFVIFAALVGYAIPASANGIANFYAEIGLENGGDQLISIPYDDGSVDDLTSGDGFTIAVGTAYYLPTASFQGTIGYKSDSIEARNRETLKIEDFSFTRVKFDGVAFHHFERHAFGAGLTFHTNVELDAPDGDVFDADNAVGFVGEYRYYFTDNTHFGLRYTDIDYTLNGSEAQETTLDGNAFGFYIGSSF